MECPVEGDKGVLGVLIKRGGRHMQPTHSPPHYWRGVGDGFSPLWWTAGEPSTRLPSPNTPG